jgi:membrane protease YdiL (CAAX protease family)
MFLSFICALIIGLSAKLIGFNNKSDVTNRLIHILQKDKLLVVFVPLTAGITEELICRGYLLTRLEMLFNKPAVSIAVSAIIFGLLHISYGTIVQILLPLCLGLIYATHYYKYRNIKVIIVCHFLWDFIGLYIGAR